MPEQLKKIPQCTENISLIKHKEYSVSKSF